MPRRLPGHKQQPNKLLSCNLQGKITYHTIQRCASLTCFMIKIEVQHRGIYWHLDKHIILMSRFSYFLVRLCVLFFSFFSRKNHLPCLLTSEDLSLNTSCLHLHLASNIWGVTNDVCTTQISGSCEENVLNQQSKAEPTDDQFCRKRKPI